MKKQINEFIRMQELAGLNEIKVRKPTSHNVYYVYDKEGMEEPIGPFNLEQANNERRRLGMDYDIMDEKTAKEIYSHLDEIKVRKPSKNLDINQCKEEALSVYNKFIDEFESQNLFEFIPDLENNYVDSSTNSLNIEELGSIYLIPNKGPIPNEVKEFMSDSNDGEINEQGITWKKYPQNGYYYIAMY